MTEWQETEFGKVPSGWVFIRATDFCQKVTDGTHDSPKQQTTGQHLITSKHIKGRNIDFENAYLISQEDYEKINLRSKVDQWDVIISMIGEYCGFAYIERNEIIDYAVKNVGIFKTADCVKSFWLYYYIQSSIGFNYLQNSRSGTSQPYITLGTLRSFPVLVPEKVEEQKAIAAVLSSLDDKIDLLHRQNKTLEAMAETLFRQWFIEEAKQDWDEKSLLDIVELVGGGTPKTSTPEYWDGEIPWLSGGDIASSHKSFVTASEKTITEEGLNNSSTKLLPKFATVISARGTVGKYALLSKAMTYSQSNYGILPKIDNCFFFTYLLINHVVGELQSSAYGSVFDTITTSTFKDIAVTVPNDNAIKIFEQSIAEYFMKKIHCLNQIRTLEKLRDTLLPKLMSGEVRVAI